MSGSLKNCALFCPNCRRFQLKGTKNSFTCSPSDSWKFRTNLGKSLKGMTSCEILGKSGTIVIGDSCGLRLSGSTDSEFWCSELHADSLWFLRSQGGTLIPSSHENRNTCTDQGTPPRS